MGRRRWPRERRGPNRLSRFSNDGQQIRWRPELTNRAVVRALGALQRIAANLTQNLRIEPPPGREERFVLRLRRALASSPLMAEAERVGGPGIVIQVRESFGKPTLVSVDLALSVGQMKLIEQHLLDPIREEAQRRTYELFLSDLLERVVQELWDNPEIAPVGVRGRFVVTDDDGKIERVLLDMRDLGYIDETARPGDLYARLGAPASDPLWRP